MYSVFRNERIHSFILQNHQFVSLQQSPLLKLSRHNSTLPNAMLFAIGHFCQKFQKPRPLRCWVFLHSTGFAKLQKFFQYGCVKAFSTAVIQKGTQIFIHILHWKKQQSLDLVSLLLSPMSTCGYFCVKQFKTVLIKAYRRSKHSNTASFTLYPLHLS